MSEFHASNNKTRTQRSSYRRCEKLSRINNSESPARTVSDAWRQHASAVDAWSFGIMLLELGAGYLYSWVAPIGKIAFQPGRLDAAVPLSGEALPVNDDRFHALWKVAMQLLDAKPPNRPSVRVALISSPQTSCLRKSPQQTGNLECSTATWMPCGTATQGCQLI